MVFIEQMARKRASRKQDGVQMERLHNKIVNFHFDLGRSLVFGKREVWDLLQSIEK